MGAVIGDFCRYPIVIGGETSYSFDVSCAVPREQAIGTYDLFVSALNQAGIEVREPISITITGDPAPSLLVNDHETPVLSLTEFQYFANPGDTIRLGGQATDQTALRSVGVETGFNCGVGSDMETVSGGETVTSVTFDFSCIVPPNAGSGDYYFDIDAYDWFGNQAIERIIVSVRTVEPPTTTWITPAPWASLDSVSPNSGTVGSEVTVRYYVDDPDGVRHTEVLFEQSGPLTNSWPAPSVHAALVGGDTTSGFYAVTLTVPERPPGTYEIWAHSEDELGNAGGNLIGTFAIVE